MLSRADEPGCLSAGFVQGFFILVCGSRVFISVVLMGVWRCPVIPLGCVGTAGHTLLQ